MTSNDPITGLLDRLAAYREQAHPARHPRRPSITPTLSGQLAELTDQAASIGRTLARATRPPSPSSPQPAMPQPRTLTATARGQRRGGGSSPPNSREGTGRPAARLGRAVFRPGYGQWPGRWARAGNSTTCACTGWHGCRTARRDLPAAQPSAGC